MAVLKSRDTEFVKVTDTYRRKISMLDNLMVVICEFTNGPAAEPDPPHSHTHEQITFVEKGRLYFFLDGKRHILGEGDIVTVPSGVPHSIQNITPFVRLIDSFTPLRDDFLKK